MTVAQFVVAVLVLAATGGGVYYFLNRDGTVAPATVGMTTTTTRLPDVRILSCGAVAETATPTMYGQVTNSGRESANFYFEADWEGTTAQIVVANVQPNETRDWQQGFNVRGLRTGRCSVSDIRRVG